MQLQSAGQRNNAGVGSSGGYVGVEKGVPVLASSANPEIEALRDPSRAKLWLN